MGGDFLFTGDRPSPYLARLIPDGVPPFTVTHGRATSSFRVPSGLYQIERSTELSVWTPFVTRRIHGESGVLFFTDNNAPTPQAFYRAVWQTLFSEDFEEGAPDWTTTSVTGTSKWEWGIPETRNLNTAHSGERVFATDLDAPLAHSVNALLTSPVIDLTGARRVSFWYDMDFPGQQEVQVSMLDDTGKKVLYVWEGAFAGQSNGRTKWSEPTPPVVVSKARLKWQLLTGDEGPHGDGFLLDDVAID